MRCMTIFTTLVNLLFHQMSLPTHAWRVISLCEAVGTRLPSGNNNSDGAGLGGMVNACELSKAPSDAKAKVVDTL